MELQFDPETSTEWGDDTITIYKDSNFDDFWGRPSSFGKTDERGAGGFNPSEALEDHERPLLLYFRSDKSGGDRGFRFTITAPISEAAVSELCEELKTELWAQIR